MKLSVLKKSILRFLGEKETLQTVPSLPEDVLVIIRDYSKPTFIYFREYNAALRLFDLSLEYKENLKKKIEDSSLREQIKICMEAPLIYYSNEVIKCKPNWWPSVSREKFMALLDEREYHMPGYAEWYFQDDIDDAWMDSDGSNEDSDLSS
jgi:hypothetical protein